MRKLKKYWKIWWILTLRTTQIAFASKLGTIIFICGKALRFFIFLTFLFLIISKTKSIVGYTFWQVLFLYGTFVLIDSLPQFFLRNVYRFRGQIINGYFDHTLLKPLNALFKVLFGGTDIMDVALIFLAVAFLIISGIQLSVGSTWNIFFYVLLIINAFFISVALHIFVVSLGVITTEVDNVIWLYRDMTQMGRFPIEVYKEPIRGILTFIIPVGIMMTFPAKALFGTLPIFWLCVSFGITFFLMVTSILFWKYALKKYSSASS